MILLSVIFCNAIHAQQVCDASKEKPTKKNSSVNKAGTYGAAITKEGTTDVKTLPEKMEKQESMKVKISGEVSAVCQVKG